MADWRDEPPPDDKLISKWTFAAMRAMCSAGSRDEVFDIMAKLDEKFPGVGFAERRDELQVGDWRGR